MTDLERAALTLLSEGEWHVGRTLTSSGNLLHQLSAKRLIKWAGDSSGFLDDSYQITDAGRAEIEVAV